MKLFLVIYLDDSSNPYFYAIKGSCQNGHIVQKQMMQKGEIGVYFSNSIEPALSPHSSSALPACLASVCQCVWLLDVM